MLLQSLNACFAGFKKKLSREESKTKDVMFVYTYRPTIMSSLTDADLRMRP